MKYFTMILLACFVLMTATSLAQPKESRLGKHTRVLISTKDLLGSMAWWSRIGYSPVTVASEKIDSAITMTDGQVVITLVKTSMPSPVLVFRTEDVKRAKQQMDSLAIPVLVEVEGPTLSELRLRSPNSVYLAIRSSAVEPDISATGAENPLCGNMTEFSSTSESVGQDQAWWKTVGFSIVKASLQPYPFTNVGDGKIEVGLHENRDIPTLAITYFMPDMHERIDRLKKAGITPIEEIPSQDGTVANAIFQSPEGQLVYLFTR